MAYIGSYGRLIRLYPVTTEEISTPEAMSFKTTMGGRVVAQSGPRGRRTWAIGYQSLFAQDVGLLEAMKAGSYGPPPWLWVPPDAMSMNALSPAVSLLEAGTFSPTASVGGPILADDGFWIPSTILVAADSTAFVGDSDSGIRWGVPVIPGETYTASVYGNGSAATFSLVFRNPSQSTLEVVTSDPMGSERVRRSVTAVAPAGAVEVLLRFNTLQTAARYGAPSVVWADRAPQWAIGKGCRKSVIESSQESIQKAIRGRPEQNRSEYSFTVREVG